MKKIVLYLVLLLFCSPVLAQPPGFGNKGFTVKGKILDEDKNPLEKLRVSIYYFNGADTLYTSTKKNGTFSINNVQKTRFYVSISGLNWKSYTKFYDLSIENNEVLLPAITLTKQSKTLSNVIITSKSAIQVKEDTLSFNADSFKTKGDLPTEELIKKLPGVEVDKDGNITTMGKQVSGVKVNGKEFFGGDVKAATREIPVEMIDKIQIIDDYGDQANFTGNKNGDPEKIINLQLRKDKNEGYFGNATIGAGTKNRYIASGSVNQFKNNTQFNITVNANNINKETFNTSMPGSRGGGRGGGNAMGRNGGNEAGTLADNTASGITNLGNIGMNYRNDANKKLSHYGSYVYTNKNTETISETLLQTFFENNNNNTEQQNIDTSKGKNHRINYNVEYKLDSNNFIKITPQFSWRTSQTNNQSNFEISNSQSLSTTIGKQLFQSNVISPYYSGNILWNHKFGKKGRTLSINTNSNFNSNTQADAYNNASGIILVNPTDTINRQNLQQVDIQNSSRNMGASFSYTEPLNTKNSLELEYRLNNSVINNDRKTANYDSTSNLFLLADSLSNKFINTYTTNKLALNWNYTTSKYNFVIGLGAQHANITIENISNNYINTQPILNFIPTAQFNYNFNRTKKINFSYFGRTSQPSSAQLQPVRDISNRQFITVGNPDLQPEFTNTFRVRFNNFNAKTNFNIFTMLRYEFVLDKITTNVRNLGLGVQETNYLNADNNNRISLYSNIGKAFSNRKYNVRWNNYINYANSLAFSNNIANYAKQLYASERLSLDVNLSDWLNISLGGTYAMRKNRYSLNAFTNQTTNTFGLFNEALISLPKNFRIQYSLNKNFNNGFASNVNANPFIINGYVEKQFLKGNKGSFRLTAYDLLNQNININRTIDNNSITDAQDNRLTQYFLLSFIYRISKFSGTQPQQEMHQGHGGPPSLPGERRY